MNPLPSPAPALTLPEFLLARITEDEAAARAVVVANHGERRFHAERGVEDTPLDAEHDREVAGPVDGPSGWSSLYVGARRMLDECEAKRRIVEEHGGRAPYFSDPCDAHDVDSSTIPCYTLGCLALPYADHPDYREEWRP